MPGQELVLELLRQPGSYPHEVDRPRVHETHCSVVFLVGPWAYKLKKAVDFGFVDFSTLASRRRAAEAELSLNRRLAGSIYDGLVSVREGEKGLELDLTGVGQGPEVEVLVRMRRLEPEQMLETLVQRGEATTKHIDELARRLADFVAVAPVERDAAGTLAALESAVRDNLRATYPLVCSVLGTDRAQALACAQLSFLAFQRRLLERRIAEGRVIDGHGDLRPEHVAYPGGSDGDSLRCVVIDCLEFDRRLRVIDVAADIAFLSMELEALGASELARRFVDGFAVRTRDPSLRAVLDFFASYRALVRAKVLSLRDDQISSLSGEHAQAEVDALRRRAARYVELASFHALGSHRARIIAVCGLSGSGKSTVARGVSEALGAPLLRSDEVRKELAGLDPWVRRREALGQGIYQSGHTDRTYDELARRAMRLLEAGSSVVVDATFLRRRSRDQLREAARQAGGSVVFLECRLDAETTARRLEARARRGDDISDATVGVWLAQREVWDAFPEGASRVVETADAPERVIANAIAALSSETMSTPPGLAGPTDPHAGGAPRSRGVVREKASAGG